ncbi:hypothetical protein ACHAWC_004002 [Mediolabrus comicus]
MAPKKEAAGSSDGGTGTGTRCHGIALRAVKVFVATAAVSGTIWGLTSGGSVARNDAATLLMKSSKATKSPEMKSKAPKEPKGGKGENQVPSVKAQTNTKLRFDGMIWPPDCGETQDQCESIFCEGLESYLQSQLCTDGITGCEAVVVCDFKEANRRLDAPKTEMLHRALQSSYDAPILVSFLVPCADPTCTNTSVEAAAAAATVTSMNSVLQSMTSTQLVNGVAAAVNSPYFATYTYTWDPATSALVAPTTVVNDYVPGYQFMGIGECLAYNGDNYGYQQAEPSGSFPASTCGSRCTQLWSPYTLVGFDYEPKNTNYCWCLYSGKGNGVGPVVTSKGNTESYQCYKYTG